jgi:hypothetical protein
MEGLLMLGGLLGLLFGLGVVVKVMFGESNRTR